MLRAHVRVFEGHEAGADAAVQVLLGDPVALTHGLVLVLGFFIMIGLILAGRKIRSLVPLAGRE
jgi:hypothetical protein